MSRSSPMPLPSSRRSSRYLALWLPFLATDRVERLWRARAGRQAGGGQSEGLQAGLKPHVIFANRNSALRLTAVNAPAAGLGLHPGLALADARSRLPDLLATEADDAADAALVEALADWCARFTPLVSLDGADGLLLDVTGAAHLFGGEAGLLTALRRAFVRHRLAIRLAFGGTPSMARALARFGPEGILDESQEKAALSALSVHALGMPPGTMKLLLRLGLRTIGMLEAEPRAPLAARFGADLLHKLDAVLGRIEEPFASRRPMPACMAERAFAEPVTQEAMILSIIRRLAQDLAHVLEQRGEGGRRFEAHVFRADGAARFLAVETGRPVRDPALVERLFRERLAALADPLDPGFGFDLVRLAVTAVERWERPAENLDGEGVAEAALETLTDHLATRLGGHRVTRVLPCDTHIPKRAAERLPAQQTEAATANWPLQRAAGEPPARPLRLFEPPEPIEALAEVPDGPPARFRWRRVLHDVAHAEGPERIAPEWWREGGKPFTRDYFRVEDREGHRYWLFREGLYDLEPREPRWFLHGLFA
jgi:protein ImuB